MADHIEQTIAELQSRLAAQEAEVRKTKEMINSLSELSGKSAIYADVDTATVRAPAVTIKRADQFYGQPLAKSVREILQMRHASGAGPASMREIYEALKEGGYPFEAKNDQNAMRGLYTSLGKNAAVFHKLPSGKFGLTAWYPKVRASKSKTHGDAADADGDNE